MKTLELGSSFSLGKLVRKLEPLKDLPLVRKHRERAFERFFETAHDHNLFRGVFSSFAEAARSAPASKPVGYDNSASASMYRERTARVYPSDYPALYWLLRVLGPTPTSLCDFGGHIGIAFYAYEKYIDYATHPVRWTVCDVPAVAQAGEALARERGRAELSFVSDLAACEGTDVFHTSGALQYVEPQLASLLSGMTKKPSHVIVNRIPVVDGEAFVTLQNFSSAFSPYHVFNRAALVGSMGALGYSLVDSWENAEKACAIAFRPERSVTGYSGFYFARA